ncbi:hypothetical protein [Flavobacterium poyangense]|uniref:hypothetical protein n=1 Tax=Flavobacterium poyangense TaxID=2204302 RepID=UPI001423ECFA|nr:hypothetical protein [Flavobacterium sp. JXAS1]
MKISKPIFFVFLVTLISVSSVMAENGPPEPPRTGKAAAGPPTPPDGAIDQNLMILVLGALFLGVHTVYKKNLKRKASM